VNGDVLRLAVEVFLSQADKRDMLADLSLPLHPDNIPPPVLNQNIQVELHCGLDFFDQSIYRLPSLLLKFIFCPSLRGTPILKKG
jgi:hypothetical protein